MENLGWNHYHIYSCEWYKHPEESKKKLLDSINKAIENGAIASAVQEDCDIKELNIMVSSMRLDTILAHGLNLSRSKAMDLIQSGKVKVNHSEVLDNDYTCRQ